MKVTELICGSVLSLIGLSLSVQMLSSGIENWDWFWRTGVNGFLFGVLFLGAGVYSLIGGKYSIYLRILASIVLILLGVIPMFILIGASQGSLASFLFVFILIATAYLGVVGTTSLDMYRRFFSSSEVNSSS